MTFIFNNVILVIGKRIIRLRLPILDCGIAPGGESRGFLFTHNFALHLYDLYKIALPICFILARFGVVGDPTGFRWHYFFNFFLKYIVIC